MHLLSQLYGSVMDPELLVESPSPFPLRLQSFIKPLRLNCLEISKIWFSTLIHFASPESESVSHSVPSVSLQRHGL